MNINELKFRVTALEDKLICKNTVKNESLDSRLLDSLRFIFKCFCNDYFDSDRELVSNMQRLATYSNDSMVDDAIIWLSDNTSRDTDELENYRGEIEDYLAEWASDFMHNMRQEECSGEWCDESCSRKQSENESAKNVADLADQWFLDTYVNNQDADWIKQSGDFFDLLDNLANFDEKHVIDDCCKELGLSNKDRKIVAKALADRAEELLADPDVWETDDYDGVYDESCSRRRAKNEGAQTYSPEELADFCLRNYNLKGQITNTLHFAPGPDDLGYEECIKLEKALEDLREAAHKVVFEAKKLKNW